MLLSPAGMVWRRGAGAAVLLGSLLLASGCGTDVVAGDPLAPAMPSRGATVAYPGIEGPVSGGAGTPFIASTTFDLARVGYEEAEYFISGTATAYTKVGSFAADGKWEVAPGATAAYKTRILVYRPIERKKFNGTVVVEWLNVSGGLDAAADWIMGHTELTRSGFAWVGVSAQYVGVEGGPSLLGLITAPLKETDPARYGSLLHPGDSFSYDIFSQTAQAIRRPAGLRPLGDLPVRRVLAAGDSQSAFRLVTYINAIHPVADIYDGFLVHSRGGNSFGSAPLSGPPQTTVTVPATARIRDDLTDPVLTLQTETDVTFLGSANARQPDSDGFRLWEVAGAAHADTYTTVVGFMDLGDSPDVGNLVVTTEVVPGFPPCAAPINSGPGHFVLKAAIAGLDRWVREGVAPLSAPRLEVAGSSTLVRDAHGNALGGVRTPYVDVPIAALSGETQPGPVVCLLFGRTTPFDAATLAALYPTHDAYVSAFDAATDRAVQAGVILPPDAVLMKAAAAASDIGR